MDRIVDKAQLRKESRRRRLWIAASVVISLLAIALITGALRKRIDKSQLNIATVDEGPLETTVSGSGHVTPAFEEIINSPVETRVLQVFVHPGDSVTQGQPLLQIDLESIETEYRKLLDERSIRQQELTQLRLNNSSQISELEMQIKVKEMEVNRRNVEVDNERRLDSIGSGTGERVRQAETAFLTARLELNQLRQRLVNERKRSAASEQVQQLGVSIFDKDMSMMKRTLDKGRIPAPHDGIVTFISNEIGSTISAGQKVAVVSDLSQFKITGEIPEGSSDKVNIGSTVTARLGATELTGHVTNITPQAKSGMISFNVTLDDPRNSRLRSGLRIELYVSYGYKNNVVRLPMGRYFRGPGDYELFVMTVDNTLSRRKVKLGDSNRNYVEVLAGLNPGDRVAVGDMESFRNSKSIKIKN